MQNVLIYAWLFEEEYQLSLIDVQVPDFVDDIMPSKILAVSPKNIYALYICIGKRMTKKEVLSFPVRLAIDVPVLKTVGPTHRDDWGLYISLEESNLVETQADVFLEKILHARYLLY